MEVDFRCLDGRMPKILLDYPEILGALVELACIAVPDLMWRDSRRGIVLEDMLDCPRGDVLSLLADKERADNPVADEFEDLSKSIIVDKHDADLVTFTLDPYRMLVEVDVLDIHIAQLGDTDTGGVDGPNNELVPRIVDGINQAEDLVMLEVFHLLLLDSRAVNSRQGICSHNTLRIEEPVERTEGRDDTVEGFWLVRLHR